MPPFGLRLNRSYGLAEGVLVDRAHVKTWRWASHVTKNHSCTESFMSGTAGIERSRGARHMGVRRSYATRRHWRATV